MLTYHRWSLLSGKESERSVGCLEVSERQSTARLQHLKTPIGHEGCLGQGNRRKWKGRKAGARLRTSVSIGSEQGLGSRDLTA